jgi:hypothetical protein
MHEDLSRLVPAWARDIHVLSESLASSTVDPRSRVLAELIAERAQSIRDALREAEIG